jgi:hypothetical protein
LTSYADFLPIRWIDTSNQQFPERKEGTAVIMIDSTSVPARTSVLVISGGDRRDEEKENHEGMNPKCCEMIDLTKLHPTPLWRHIKNQLKEK